MNITEAIEVATIRAEENGHACTVWRCNDRYAVAVEDNGFPESLVENNPGPVRPIVTIDPDGTQHS